MIEGLQGPQTHPGRGQAGSGGRHSHRTNEVAARPSAGPPSHPIFNREQSSSLGSTSVWPVAPLCLQMPTWGRQPEQG